MTKQEKLKHIAKHIASYYSDEIWTSVNIGDCLDWIEKLPDTEYEIEMSRIDKLCSLWKSKRLPIDEQSDECIDYIYSIIK